MEERAILARSTFSFLEADRGLCKMVKLGLEPGTLPGLADDVVGDCGSFFTATFESDDVVGDCGSSFTATFGSDDVVGSSTGVEPPMACFDNALGTLACGVESCTGLESMCASTDGGEEAIVPTPASEPLVVNDKSSDESMECKSLFNVTGIDFADGGVILFRSSIL